ncbi:olfactory receptor 52K1-like [Rhinatrema bivittatum]|uniref:olfactory receptor 52K1-like n=1 Tax=Rhinatrema bivittatum TaxID=194408 RepID=UPI00112AECE5|nr:olfactory receptor 52K1-like [Rhinatrema bivittatum]
MLDLNNTSINPLVFILVGFPGLEAFHIWISLPFCAMFAIAVSGNVMLLLTIKTEQSLHKPMFFFLSMLAATDFIISVTIMPKMLSLFWFNSSEIVRDLCLLQMFFIHTFTCMESGVLVAMAFDRYVAICNPLRYAIVLTHMLVTKLGLLAFFRSLILVIPFPVLAKRLLFCDRNVISHTYCDHMAVVRLACVDFTVNSMYVLIVAVSTGALDILFIALSYTSILRAVLRLPSKEAQHKAFSTCTAHILVILVFYTPCLFSTLTYRYGHHVPPNFQILMSNLYLLLPPMFNPLVYGIKAKLLRQRVLSMFSKKWVVSEDYT